MSSGAISPARAPPSMLMLQTVIRCSMVRARIASPVYSKTWPGPAADPDPRDQGEDDVLGADTGRQPAVDPDLVGLRVALEQGLGGEDHLDLARPDPEGERTERPVRARVRIAAHDRHPGLGQSHLRPDDVDDALGRVADAVHRDPELGAVGLELVDLGERHRVDERQAAIRGRDRVVGRRHRLVWASNADPAGAEAGERLRAGDLVDEMEVDRQDRRGARVLGDDVVTSRSCRRSCGGAVALISRAYQRSPENDEGAAKAAPLESRAGRR